MKRLFIIALTLIQVSNFAFAQEATKIDTGDTAWLLIASALVMLMTVPGLALFYGGMSKKKDALNTISMSIISYIITSIIWVTIGYTLAFGEDKGGIIGSTSKLLLDGVSKNNIYGTIPEPLFIVFQLTFAAITLALISGAFIERMKFSSWVIFSVVWSILVYSPIAHWVWGGGFLTKMGILDFAGGTVVHINAGISALAGVLILGKRKEPYLRPHNLTFVIIGMALLWFGWFGFNAGSALAANGLSTIAFLNTNTAASVASLTWMITEWIINKKPTTLGIASGAIAGLVAITPAAGFVNIQGAIIIGVFSGILPYMVIVYLKPILKYDDALDVFGIHGIAGIVGAILTGVLADPSINELGKGVIYGNPNQILVQLIGVVVTIVYSFIVSSIIIYTIKILTGIRVSKNDEIIGLDQSQHGEKAYNLHV